jgi:hypothetical protein
MASPADVISVLVVLEFVAMAAVVLVLFPFDVVAPVVPLLVVFLVALLLYRS